MIIRRDPKKEKKKEKKYVYETGDLHRYIEPPPEQNSNKQSALIYFNIVNYGYTGYGC